MGDENTRKNGTITFEFPILETRDESPMNNIPLSFLPSFQEMSFKYPDTFMFEFDVLCISYDYTSDAHKIKLFPATLKGEVLRWFMRLGVGSI